ncbi:MAG: DUF2442 domain-containing protein [Schwartzia sp.]|nr:DUF2442 domain-containing protein [Schwartzia sp. (in: firmicutes)]
MLDNKWMPEILQVIPDDDYGVYMYFNDGSVKYKNLRSLIFAGGVFAPFQNKEAFRNSLTVMNHTVAFDLEKTYDPCRVVDLDPLELYKTGEPSNCPLM